MNCLYGEYTIGFQEARAALEARDPKLLAILRVDIAHLLAQAQLAAHEGFADAVQGRPQRAHVHFCREFRHASCCGCTALV